MRPLPSGRALMTWGAWTVVPHGTSTEKRIVTYSPSVRTMSGFTSQMAKPVAQKVVSRGLSRSESVEAGARTRPSPRSTLKYQLAEAGEGIIGQQQVGHLRDHGDRHADRGDGAVVADVPGRPRRNP